MNYQKGFIVPLLLALVALLLASGAYVYMQKNQAKQSAVVTPLTQATSTKTPSTQSDPFQNLSKEQQQSLDLARSKARDALIQSNLSTVQNQANVNYSDIGKTYAGFCNDPFVVDALANIRTATGITPTACNSSVTAFAAASPLATDDKKFWCVDSTGFSGETKMLLGTKKICPR
jgi:hypothetical protein